MAASTGPIGAEEFAALMTPLGPFQRDRVIAVAVSGGADSLSLAILLAAWGRPQALVVDHGLRRSSAREAAETMERLAAWAIPARLLALEGISPRAEAARTARYAALAQACAAAGWTDLALGHHAQDQAETVLMQESHDRSGAGQAGMSAVTIRGSVRLLRPLLDISPVRLRTTAVAAGAGWVEDPSNTDPATPRAQLRRRFAGEPGLQPAALDRARAAGRVRQDRERAVAAELAACATIRPEGFAIVHTDRVSCAALSALVWMVSGQAHPPPSAAVARYAPGLRAGTLHGVMIARAGRFGPGWLVVREHAACAPGFAGDALWDRRFRLQTKPEPTGAAPVRDVPTIVRRTMPSLPGWETPMFDPARPVAPAPFMSP